MTSGEKELLLACLLDTREIDPEGDIDVEDQFRAWCEVRESVVCGEVHYKAVLEAHLVRKQSLGPPQIWEGWQPEG